MTSENEQRIRRDLRRRRRDRARLRLAGGAGAAPRLRARARPPGGGRDRRRRGDARPGRRGVLGGGAAPRAQPRVAAPLAGASPSSSRQEAELEVGFAQRGALHVALDRDEAEELRRRYELHRSLGLESEWLRGGDCRRLEPGLATRGSRRRARPRRGERRSRGRWSRPCWPHSTRAGSTCTSGAEVVGAERRAGAWRIETADGRAFEGAQLVLAAGCWSGQARWLPEAVRSGPSGEGRDPDPARLGRASRSASGSSPASGSTWCPGPTAG